MLKKMINGKKRKEWSSRKWKQEKGKKNGTDKEREKKQEEEGKTDAKSRWNQTRKQNSDWWKIEGGSNLLAMR